MCAAGLLSCSAVMLQCCGAARFQGPLYEAIIFYKVSSQDHGIFKRYLVKYNVFHKGLQWGSDQIPVKNRGKWFMKGILEIPYYGFFLCS